MGVNIPEDGRILDACVCVCYVIQLGLNCTVKDCSQTNKETFPAQAAIPYP